MNNLTRRAPAGCGGVVRSSPGRSLLLVKLLPYGSLATSGRVQECPPLTDVKMLHHCWHDVNVKFPGGRLKTVNVPTRDGRVCCYCGEIRPEPLPPMRPKRAHGPHVDDDSEWYVLDEAECPGLSLVDLNPDPVVVPMTTRLTQA